ncbi:PREDICTED: matrix metalloproteinase-26 isoform X1 [Ceratotherium simum simum]|uniref:Matrix metalloproteinase-26 isoform X1 n=1 Tax=Ceratotherium simum simum TaxID=73337 RepID=A0ABM1D1N5_CERSS|nr:PREDICTED: matrix metalloproteinase-26 isoform X1 [Ceratotherium simum simum]
MQPAILIATIFLPWCLTFPVPPGTDLKRLDFVMDNFHQFFLPKKESPHLTQRKEIQFQQQFHLNETDVQNKQMLAMLHLPRCGVTDAATDSIFPGSSKWNKHTLTYRIINYPRDMKPDTVKDIMHDAVSVWSNVTPLIFQQAKSQDADIMLSFWDLAHGDDWPFDGPGGILGHAFLPDSEAPGVIHFDKGERWSNSYKGFNLFLVAIHELGHSLGLRHSRSQNSIMYPSYVYQDPRTFHLDVDDIQRIQQLYGVCLLEGRGISAGSFTGSLLFSSVPIRKKMFI